MTIFEKIKNMNQDEAVEYVRNGFCKTRESCKDCPMYCLGCQKEVFSKLLTKEIIQ